MNEMVEAMMGVNHKEEELNLDFESFKDEQTGYEIKENIGN